MNALRIKTPSEQKLEWLESLRRPLSDEESDELRRALHAVYCRKRKARMLGKHAREERRLLRTVQAESRQREWYPEGGR